MAVLREDSGGDKGETEMAIMSKTERGCNIWQRSVRSEETEGRQTANQITAIPICRVVLSVGPSPALRGWFYWEGNGIGVKCRGGEWTVLFTAAGSDLCTAALRSLSCWWTLLSEYLLGPLKADERLIEEKAYSVTSAFLCKCVCAPRIPSCN